MISSESCNNVQQNKCNNYHAAHTNLVGFSPESTYCECRIAFVRNIKLKQEVE